MGLTFKKKTKNTIEQPLIVCETSSYRVVKISSSKLIIEQRNKDAANQPKWDVVKLLDESSLEFTLYDASRSILYQLLRELIEKKESFL